MTTQPDPRSLLLAVMRSQTWEPLDVVPPVDRYRRAVDGSEPLSRAEQRQLLRSPTARLHHGIARREARAAAQARWLAARMTLSNTRLAAGSPDEDRAEFSAGDWSLVVQRLRKDEWVLILDVHARELLDIGALELELTDETGRVWLRGTPDSRGQVHGGWEDPESPIALLALHELRLRPY